MTTEQKLNRWRMLAKKRARLQACLRAIYDEMVPRAKSIDTDAHKTQPPACSTSASR